MQMNWRMVVGELFLATLATAQPVPPDYGSVNREALTASIVSLIANGPEYDGKAVRLLGAFRIEFEGDTLCLDMESLRHGVNANCISLGAIDPEALGTTREGLSLFNDRYALVEGVFRVAEKGHISVNVAGGLNPVTRVAPLDDPP